MLSPAAQRRHGFRVESLPVATRTAHEDLYGSAHGQQEQDAFEERLRDNTRTPVPDQAAFRIIQESLTNVIRHSTAKQATVRLDQDGQWLRIAVVDHGPARPSATVTSAGFGIVGMTGRAQAVGGELSARPEESGGFEVRASLPLPETRRVPS